MPRIPLSQLFRIRATVVVCGFVGVSMWLSPPLGIQVGVLVGACVAVALGAAWGLARRLPVLSAGMLVVAMTAACLVVLMQAGPSSTLWAPAVLVPVLVARFTGGRKMALITSVVVGCLLCVGLYLAVGTGAAARLGAAGVLWLAVNVLSDASEHHQQDVQTQGTDNSNLRLSDPQVAAPAHVVDERRFPPEEIALPRFALQQAARAIHQLIGTILTSVDLVMDEVSEYGEAGQDLHELRRSAHRASELAVRLMVVARNQSPDPEKVWLGSLLEAMLPEIGAALGPHVQLELSVLPGISPVHMGERQLRDALAEIIRNASDAMGPMGVVRIAAFTSKDVPAGCVRLVVEDSGPGMSALTRGRAFQPFFSTRGRGESAGLGLTVVHAIIAQAGGTVTLASRPGGGTQVVMDLPKMASLHVDGSGLAGSAVVVGSEQGEAAVIAGLLRDRGHLVRFAPDASAGLQALSITGGQTEFLIVEASDDNFDFVRLMKRDWEHLDVVWLGRADPRLPPSVIVFDNVPVYGVVDELGRLAAA